MKTLFSILLAAIFATSATANGDFTLKVFGQVIELNTAQWSKSDITVKILDEDGHVLVQKNYPANVSVKSKRFNVSKLIAGNYEFILSDNQKISKHSFSVKPDAVEIAQNSETFNKPHFALSGTDLKINYLNLGNLSNIKILNNINETVYEAFINTPIYSKQFDLALLDKGEVTVILTQGSEIYTQIFNIK